MRVPRFVAIVTVLVTAGVAQQLAPPFRVVADGKPIDVDGGHAVPYFADVDGDGLRDLLVGQFWKSRCRVYKNVGTKEQPAFGDYVFLDAGGKPATVDGG